VFDTQTALGLSHRVGGSSPETKKQKNMSSITTTTTITDLPADADEGASFEADLAKGRAARAQARQWAAARAFRYENALADY